MSTSMVIFLLFVVILVFVVHVLADLVAEVMLVSYLKVKSRSSGGTYE